MKYVAIVGLAFLGIVAMGRPAFAQSADPDFDAALLSVASSGSVTAAAVTAAGVEAPEGVEGSEGVEAPEATGDTGPNIDHQFEGQETGENGNGIPGSGGGG